MIEMYKSHITMTAGDYGIPLTVCLSPLSKAATEALHGNGKLRFSIFKDKELLVERHAALKAVDPADYTFKITFTEEDTAHLSPGLYTWRLALLRDGVLKCSLAGGELTVTELPAAPQEPRLKAHVLTVPMFPVEWSALNPQGDYDPNQVYERLDLVRFEGGSYVVCTSGLCGVPPTDGGDYMLLVKDGRDGRAPMLPTSVHPASHAFTHRKEGADPLTPESIGAAAEDHSHTAQEVGAAPASHAHTADQVGADPAGSAAAAESRAIAAAATDATQKANAAKAASVPITRKVNGKTLNADIDLGPSDVHAGPRQNLLANPSFTVWQRYPDGVYAGTPWLAYVSDRYRLSSTNGNTPNALRRVKGGGIKNESGPIIKVEYLMENASALNGRTVTLSYLVENSGERELRSETLTANGWQDNTDVLFQFAMGCWLRSGETIIQIKLELGDTQTLAHQEDSVWVLNELPDYGEELAKCQHFFQRYTGEGAAPVMLGTAIGSSATTAYACVSLTSPLQGRPALSASGLSLYDGAAVHAISSLHIRSMSQNHDLVELAVTCSAGGLTPGRAYGLQLNSGSSYAEFIVPFDPCT